MKYEIKREVTLMVNAKDEETAISVANNWHGSVAVGGAGISHGIYRLEWDGKSKHLSLKLKRKS